MTSVERPPATWICLAPIISPHDSFFNLFLPHRELFTHALVTLIKMLLLDIIIQGAMNQNRERGLAGEEISCELFSVEALLFVLSSTEPFKALSC